MINLVAGDGYSLAPENSGYRLSRYGRSLALLYRTTPDGNFLHFQLGDKGSVTVDFTDIGDPNLRTSCAAFIGYLVAEYLVAQEAGESFPYLSRTKEAMRKTSLLTVYAAVCILCLIVGGIVAAWLCTEWIDEQRERCQQQCGNRGIKTFEASCATGSTSCTCN